MSEALLEAVRGLHVADPDLGVKPLLAKLREQQPDLWERAIRKWDAHGALCWPNYPMGG